jgi:hypothetical protein
MLFLFNLLSLLVVKLRPAGITIRGNVFPRPPGVLDNY